MKIIFATIVLILVASPGTHRASGQTKPATDTTSADPKLLGMYAGMFEKAWCAKFSELWNGNSDTVKVLANMGKVNFVSIGPDTTAVLFEFDSLGRARYGNVKKSMPDDTIPTFTARLEKWADFMEGRFTSIAGVLTGKIKYKGPMTVAFKYGFAFNKVAPFGKRASRFIYESTKVK